MNKLVASVENSITRRKLFPDGAKILVAVSGGLDSSVLLHVLAQLAKKHRWQLSVAHFNHQLRGRASNLDERFVQSTAKQLRLPAITDRADVLTFSREQKLSVEMAARKLRHQFLARAAKKVHATYIALAHHADDQAELFFVRLLRGSSGEGLAGMKWQNPSPAARGIFLTRPLLDQTRASLVAYADEHSIQFREDASNASLDIQRNRIRRELLPLLAEKYQSGIARILVRQMEILGAESDFLNDVAAQWLTKKKTSFVQLPLALQRRALQLQLIQNGVALNFDLIEQLRESPDEPVTLDPSRRVSRDASGLITVHDSVNPAFQDHSLATRLAKGAGEIAFENVKITWSREKMPSGTFRAPLARANFERFDADKVGNDILLRHWRLGDRFQPIGFKQPAKLSDLFINEKVPRARRHECLVAATGGGEIFWIEGLRLGERFKLDNNTRYQLKWRWKRVS